MTTRLNELRNRIKKADEAVKAKSTSQNYPFWNQPTDTNSIIRFLPFKGDEAGIFWNEVHMRPLTFCGILGEDEGKPVTINVPSMTMYGEKDRVNEHLRPLWDTDKETARKFYHKKSFEFYGFVIKSPFEEVDTAAVRRFRLSNSIFTKIKNGLLDEDLGLENHPCGVEDGSNFVINKTQQGQYASYDGSSWAKKETALTKEQAAVYNQSLIALDDFTFAKPDEERQEIIYQMFLDSYNGELYDPDKYARFYKPYGYEAN
jgi:hypothetical protein